MTSNGLCWTDNEMKGSDRGESLGSSITGSGEYYQTPDVLEVAKF